MNLRLLVSFSDLLVNLACLLVSFSDLLVSFSDLLVSFNDLLVNLRLLVNFADLLANFYCSILIKNVHNPIHIVDNVSYIHFITTFVLQHKKKLITQLFSIAISTHSVFLNE